MVGSLIPAALLREVAEDLLVAGPHLRLSLPGVPPLPTSYQLRDEQIDRKTA